MVFANGPGQFNDDVIEGWIKFESRGVLIES
jgi:hypothetical protein